jgi:hypothetical protein
MPKGRRKQRATSTLRKRGLHWTEACETSVVAAQDLRLVSGVHSWLLRWINAWMGQLRSRLETRLPISSCLLVTASNRPSSPFPYFSYLAPAHMDTGFYARHRHGHAVKMDALAHMVS